MQIPEQNLNRLLDVVKMIIVGVMGADAKGGPFKTMREMKAGSDYMTKAHKLYDGNALIQQVAADMTADNDLLSDEGQQVDLNTVGYEDIFNAVSQIDMLIGAGNPEGHEFKEFLYDLAYTIADASGTGVMGRGEKISDYEAGFLNILRERLGLV